MTTSRKRKVGIIGIVILILVGCIVGILAYYSQTREIENFMATPTSEVYLLELFNENDYWVVGETKQKEVAFGNSGETSQVIRISYESVWLEESENTEGDMTWQIWGEADEDAATINWTDAFEGEDSMWTLIDGYYYYNYVLEPDETTAIVMTSVSFSNEISNGGYDSELDYSDKKYSLIFEMQALSVNSSATSESWGVTFEESNGVLSWTAVASSDT